ncbi:hypothetical protein ACIRVK_39930 [Streptomyces sp. NPDC101152]|uniref:hypothetical protein n=1 Tax=Streptomyces sp. NPDC101152 TaxID=3366116 RepID=UPI00380C86C1
MSFALTVASSEHLPAERGPGGWKHRQSAGHHRSPAVREPGRRRASGGEGGIIAVTQPPLPVSTAPTRDHRSLLPLPAGPETLHVLARPLSAGTRSMLLLPCAGPTGLRGKRLRVTFPDGRGRTAVAVSVRGQAAISVPAETTATIAPHGPGIPLALQPIRERAAHGVPDDLTAALERAEPDWSVLPAHEQAQMLHLITESATADIRTARITAVIDAVATRTRS